MQKKELSYTIGRNSVCCNLYGNQYGSYWKKNPCLSYDPAIPLLGIYLLLDIEINTQETHRLIKSEMKKGT
jgi:hypothetical protein